MLTCRSNAESMRYPPVAMCILLAVALVVVGIACARERSYDQKPFPFIQNQRFGFIDANGSIAIQPQFLWASRFSEGRAIVMVCRRYGYIDSRGKIVIGARFDDAGMFSDGLAAVRLGKRFGFINRAGRIVIQPKYDFALNFDHGEAGVRMKGREGAIDRSGHWIVPPHFDEILGFSDGMSAASVGNDWGYINRSGSVLIPFQYKSAASFADGRATVTTKTGEDQIIDKSGRVVLRNVNEPWGFSEGLAPVQLQDENSYRYIDVNGHVAIKGPFDTALPFSEGLAAVQLGGEWGFIDRKGAFVIRPRFEQVEGFRHGRAFVKVGEKWGIIDRLGKFLVQPQFQEILGSPGEVDEVTMSNNEWGYIDAQGRLFWRAPETQRPRYSEQNPLEGVTERQMEENCDELRSN